MRVDKVAIARIVVLAGMFAACTFLFYQQATGAYASDLPAHLAPMDADSYSAFRLVLFFTRDTFGLMGPAVFLALLEIATIGITEYFIRKLAPDVKPWVALVLAIACNFVIAIYLRFVYHNFTVGSPSANRWHNSTYTGMRFLAMCAIVFYLKFDGQIKTKSKALSWVLFTVMLIAATLTKPNFVVAFGPAMLVFCIIDLVRNGKSTVPKSLLVGLSLLIALIVVVCQVMLLYPADGSAKGDNHIAFGIAVFWTSRNPNVFVNFFQVMAFPLLAAIATRPLWRTDRNYLLAILVLIVSFFESFFLYETGSRMSHGNFGWGLCFGLFYAFIASAIAFVNARGRAWKLVRETDAARPSGAGGGEARADAPAAQGVEASDGVALGSGVTAVVAAPPDRRTPLDVATLVVFALHTASGLLYFGLMLLGRQYF